jgi:hypothetical protein
MMIGLLRSFLLGLLVLLGAGCNLSYGTPTPYPTPDIPRVEFLAPQNGDAVAEGTELLIELLGHDSGVGVARIELFVDDILYQEVMPQASSAVPEFAVVMNWMAQGIGYHSLMAVAYRPDGSASDPITLTINVIVAP